MFKGSIVDIMNYKKFPSKPNVHANERIADVREV